MYVYIEFADNFSEKVLSHHPGVAHGLFIIFSVNSFVTMLIL